MGVDPGIDIFSYSYADLIDRQRVKFKGFQEFETEAKTHTHHDRIRPIVYHFRKFLQDLPGKKVVALEACGEFLFNRNIQRSRGVMRLTAVTGAIYTVCLYEEIPCFLVNPKNWQGNKQQLDWIKSYYRIKGGNKSRTGLVKIWSMHNAVHLVKNVFHVPALLGNNGERLPQDAADSINILAHALKKINSGDWVV